ncbi:MAG TPA: hypothetical protein VK943_10355, partial [Arenibaculum sp.]|nr:hypothetical protein [Arenibaculum sp.]
MYPDSEPGGHRPSYLERLDRLPDREKWPVVRGWLASEPRPLCEELREHRPILATPDVTLVTRRADVVEVLSLPSIFTVDLYADRMGEFMLSRDETPMNTRDKGIMQAMLSRDDLPRIRARVGELADEALDAADGRMEAVSQAARLVPLRIVQEYCGIEGPDEDLLRWSYASQLNQFNNLPFDGRRDADAVHEAALRARDEMVDHLTRLIAARGSRA